MLVSDTVRIRYILRKDVKGGDYRNAMIPGALRADLTSSSPARRRFPGRGHASSSARLALPRADCRVGLPHQAVRLVFSRGLWRSLGGLRLGSQERHRLRSSLNHVFAASAARAASYLAQRIESRVNLL